MVMFLGVWLFAMLVQDSVRTVPVQVSGHDWFSGVFGLALIGIWIYAAAFIVAPRLRDAGLPGLLAVLVLLPVVKLLLCVGALLLPSAAVMPDSTQNHFR
jgi:uncharacterized membrane protein YhaH (DUF805 family)